jgi:phage gp29-like protein
MEQHATEGIPYEGLENIWVVGDADDLGLLLKCGFYALLKKGTITDWAEYIEIFGSPIITMTYDAGDRQTELKLDEVLDNIGNSTRIKVPRQAGLDVKDGKASNGDGSLQLEFVNAMNRELSTIILGNTETTTSSDSSGYAQSQIHAMQQLEITKSDMVDVLDTLNSTHFFNILRSYGLPVDGGMFEYDKEIDINYLEARVAVDKQLKDIGLPMGKKYFYDTYAIPVPTAGDAISEG